MRRIVAFCLLLAGVGLLVDHWFLGLGLMALGAGLGAFSVWRGTSWITFGGGGGGGDG